MKEGYTVKCIRKFIAKYVFLCIYCFILIGCLSDQHTLEEYQQAEKIAMRITKSRTYSNDIVMESSEYIPKTDEYKMIFLINKKRRFEVTVDMSEKNEEGKFFIITKNDYID